jgi:hypothetical protein
MECASKEYTIVVAPIVIDELDKRKIGTNRVGKREEK